MFCGPADEIQLAPEAKALWRQSWWLIPVELLLRVTWSHIDLCLRIWDSSGSFTSCSVWKMIQCYAHLQRITVSIDNKHACNKLCGRPPQYATASYVTLTFDLLTLKVVSESRVTCVNFSLPRPLCSRLRTDVRDRQTSNVRQTDVRQTLDAHHRLMPPRREHNKSNTHVFVPVTIETGVCGTIRRWN